MQDEMKKLLTYVVWFICLRILVLHHKSHYLPETLVKICTHFLKLFSLLIVQYHSWHCHYICHSQIHQTHQFQYEVLVPILINYNSILHIHYYYQLYECFLQNTNLIIKTCFYHHSCQLCQYDTHLCHQSSTSLLTKKIKSRTQSLIKFKY